ncbi:MAG: hypothetical protein M3R59_10675, partial [Verrucomicrobiota bacterium]|nr:hypothetical protein [Verrucomicrobiota bacterium]
MRAVVYAPSFLAGGVKSLYAVCGWLNQIGRCRIRHFGPAPELAAWFTHDCELDGALTENVDLVIYPEIFQPRLSPDTFYLCFAIGRFQNIQPHADLVVCRSTGVAQWLQEHAPQLRHCVIDASIERRRFEYDGRVKRDQICYFMRAEKSPETAALLRERYG